MTVYDFLINYVEHTKMIDEINASVLNSPEERKVLYSELDSERFLFKDLESKIKITPEAICAQLEKLTGLKVKYNILLDFEYFSDYARYDCNTYLIFVDESSDFYNLPKGILDRRLSESTILTSLLLARRDFKKLKNPGTAPYNLKLNYLKEAVNKIDNFEIRFLKMIFEKFRFELAEESLLYTAIIEILKGLDLEEVKASGVKV